MYKPELIEKIMTKTKAPMTKADAERVVNGFIEEIINAVANGESVQLTGFGTFENRRRAARKAHNPQTGEAILIPEKRVPAFKPGKAFKDIVNK